MRILCFRDHGYDPGCCFGNHYEAEDHWPDLPAKQTVWEIVDAGINGREIPRNPYMLRLLTEHQSVDIFPVMPGTNDLLQGALGKEAAAIIETFLNPPLPHYKNILLAAPHQ